MPRRSVTVQMQRARLSNFTEHTQHFGCALASELAPAANHDVSLERALADPRVVLRTDGERISRNLFRVGLAPRPDVLDDEFAVSPAARVLDALRYRVVRLELPVQHDRRA